MPITENGMGKLVPIKGWARIKEAAVYAGVKERTIRDWMKDDLRFARLSHKLVLIKYTDIDDYLEKFIGNDVDLDMAVNSLMNELN